MKINNKITLNIFLFFYINISLFANESEINKNFTNYHKKINEIKLKNLNEIQTIYQINKYVNTFKYKSDKINYNQEDYYASPIEMITKGSGDCEDYAILKYNTLITEFNIDKNKLSFQYVLYGKNKIPHIILVYKDDKEYILDNNINTIDIVNKNNYLKVFEISNNKIYISNNEYSIPKNSKLNKLVHL